MFDGFQIKILVARVFDQLKKRLRLVKHSSEQTQKVFSRTTMLDGIRVRLINRNSKVVKLNGSLHCYYTGGHNDTLFTYKELVTSARRLSKEFCFELHDAELKHIEFGVNIPVENPEEMIDSAILFDGKPATGRRQNRKKYHKEWALSEYLVKLYRKGSHLVRFEIRMFKRRKRKEVQLYTLADLLDYDKFCFCLNYLESLAEKFLFVPDGIDIVPDAMKASWANYRNDQYWKRFNGKKRCTKSRMICELVKYIKNTPALVDWNSVLVDGIRQQGALMISPEDATFSSLGLLGDAVAGPEGNCNRLKGEVGPQGADSPSGITKHSGESKNTILVRIHLLEAYNGCMTNAIIFPVLSYVPLYPRGPPSSFSFPVQR